jgi:hypothetical protein
LRQSSVGLYLAEDTFTLKKAGFTMFIKRSVVIALLCSSFCLADVIRSQPGGYAFDLPQGWTLDRSQKDFKVVGPDKIELSELPLPQPPSGQSLELETRLLVQSFVLIWGTNSTGQTFDLSGKKWQGRAVVLDMPPQTKEAPHKIVAFVAKSGKQFRRFSFLISAEQWRDNSQQYLAILRTLKFPD